MTDEGDDTGAAGGAYPPHMQVGRVQVVVDVLVIVVMVVPVIVMMVVVVAEQPGAG